MSEDKPDVTHYFSGEQVLKRAWDVETDSLKVIQSEHTAFEVELNAEDGDSVLSLAECATLSLHDAPIDCRRMRRAKLYGNAKVMVSPLDDGDVFMELVMVDVMNICAKRVKLLINIGEEAHLVLQS